MSAALVARHGVDLVYDHGARRSEHAAAALRREQDVERLRSGDEDVRRRLCHPLPVGLRRVTGPHRREDLGNAESAQLRERLEQVLAHVVRESLQW
jgi:hypothetical protein